MDKDDVLGKHHFSEHWEGSDVILVVENEKFHVHRQMLSLHSPVFKAMLNSAMFKEATAKEIPLPEKNPDEILDFLNILYLKERDAITLNKVDDLLKLADEYQVQGIVDICVKVLQGEPISEQNAITILYLATCTAAVREDGRLEGVRGQCYSMIKNMELADIQGEEDYEYLESEILERVLVNRNQRLETFVKGIYPQFIGLMECCLWAFLEKDSISVNHSRISPCPQHFSDGKANADASKRMITCSKCRRMIKQLVSISKVQTLGSLYGGQPSNTFKYGGSVHFDEKVIAMILDFQKIVKL
ncbi:BTB and MATH domain-containing protein 42-like [Montipora capricornis]|uniref:BTB and MATH domain-containing protein 42-like n=1 Tax=Montipora foliosa TaxID=591990 RepID=UPI0035F1C3A7